MNKKEKMNTSNKHSIKEMDQKKYDKQLEKKRKKIGSLLKWSSIEEITEEGIILKEFRKKYICRGIKVSAVNIHLLNSNEIVQRVDQLSSALNKMRFKIYWCFVFNEPNLDTQNNHLLKLYNDESDDNIKDLIRIQMDKNEEFLSKFKEICFYLVIQEDEKHIDKNFDILYSEMKRANFFIEVMNQSDYANYIQSEFQNEAITDYYFPRFINDSNFNALGSSRKMLQAKKEKLLPLGFDEYRNYYRIGDKYERCITIMNLPMEYFVGLIGFTMSNRNFRIKMLSEPTKLDLSTLINKQSKKLKQDYTKERDLTTKEKLKEQYSALDNFVKEIASRHDRTLNVSINLFVTANSIEELNDLTKEIKDDFRRDGWSLNILSNVQAELFKYSSALFVNDGLRNEMKVNAGNLLSSYQIAGLWPFLFDTVEDEQGTLIGYELANGGKIVFDQFKYLHNHDEAVLENRKNSNIVVVGDSGSGKTTAMDVLIMQHILAKRKIVWVCPENKNYKLTRKYGGSFINWGKSKDIINLFDLLPISCEEDEEVDMWNTELAIYNAIALIKTVLTYLHTNENGVIEIDNDTLNQLAPIVLETYKRYGITFDSDFRYLKPTDYPTFTDLIAVLEEKIDELKKYNRSGKELDLYENLNLKLQPMLFEWKRFLNGHTTIDRNDKMISFGTKALLTQQKNVSNALTHVMYNFAWSLCLDEEESAFIQDEAHVIILIPLIAFLLAQFQRRSRKYNNATLIGTQETNDFASPKIAEHGLAIFNNAAYKLVMFLQSNAIRTLEKLMDLTDSEVNLISGFTQGQGLLFNGNKGIAIKIFASEDEVALM